MAIQQIRGYRTMNSKNKLIDDFTEDAEIMGFQCVSTFTVIKVFDMNRKPILKIYFEIAELEPVLDYFRSKEPQPVHDASRIVRVFDLGDVNTQGLDQYSWLFSRASELLHDLKEA